MSRSDDDGAVGEALERALADLLDGRRPGASVCPSEAARRVDPGEWRPLMDAARRAAGRMAARGEAEVTQGGVVVDIGHARGPVRVRRPSG